jgi:hypothetical protein
MRWSSILALHVVLSLPAIGAQVGIHVRCEKDTFLVYESIPVNLSIHNYSGRPLELADNEGKSWLGFMITDEGNGLVRAVAEPETKQPLLIGPGQSVTRTIDLLPLYELRARGSYRVQAIVRLGGTAAVSAPLDITVTNGREVWSQVVGLPAGEGTGEEYRTYSLLARRGEREDSLYIGVQDESRQIVYSLVSLGGFLSTTTPQALIDSEARLHVLFQNGPRSFGYACVDSSAKQMARAAYADFQSSPMLVLDAGKVEVRGGEQIYPRPEHILATDDGESAPVTKPKPKRRWWWPFSSRS